MATFYAVPKDKFPVGWDGEESFSDIRFLREVKEHAIACEFDTQDEDNEEIFYRDWEDGQYPVTFHRWADSQGKSADEFMFIVAGSDYELADAWPKDDTEVWAAWPDMSHVSISVSTMLARLMHNERERNKLESRLTRLIEVDNITVWSENGQGASLS